MNKERLTRLLLGNELRTLRQNGGVVNSIHDQSTFDELFGLIFHHETPLVMRAVDAIEKVTAKRPGFTHALNDLDSRRLDFYEH